jgi:hypothetical protein
MALSIIAQLAPLFGIVAGLVFLGIATKGDLDNGR